MAAIQRGPDEQDDAHEPRRAAAGRCFSCSARKWRWSMAGMPLWAPVRSTRGRRDPHRRHSPGGDHSQRPAWCAESARPALLRFGPTNPARRPKPTGIRGYLRVSRRNVRRSAVAGQNTKCPQTRAFSLVFAGRVWLAATTLNIVVSRVRVPVSPLRTCLRGRYSRADIGTLMRERLVGALRRDGGDLYCALCSATCVTVVAAHRARG